MKKRNSIQRALLASVLSLVLCVSMLIGTTFAWFTDIASSGVNKIVAGNLDIKLSYKNAADQTYKEVTSSAVDLFVDANEQKIEWEPGALSVCYFMLENLGSLDAVYQMAVSFKDTVTYTNASNEEIKLSNALESAIVPMTDDSTLSREEAIAAVTAEGHTVALGYNASTRTKLASLDTVYFAMVIYMPTNIDNKYNLPTGEKALEIQLGVDLVATQDTSEYDSYGNQYDFYSEYPPIPDRVYVAEVVPYTNNKPLKAENYEKGYWITIPANAIVPNPSNLELKEVVIGLESVESTYTFSLEDEKGNALTLSQPASIRIQLPTGYENVKVNGADANYGSTGMLTINTQQTGAYEVTYDIPGVTVVSNADEFIAAMNGIAAENTSGIAPTIYLNKDIDLTGKAFTGVDNVSFTLEGNGKTISNITNTNPHGGNQAAGGIVNYIGNGNSAIIKNVTLDTLTIGNESQVPAEAVGVAGGVVGYIDAAREVTLENVTVKNATILSADDVKEVLHYAGGLIGYGVGYQNTNDGAVFTLINIKNCTLTASDNNTNTIRNTKGTAGGAIGHASASTFTTTTITNFKADKNVITAEKDTKAGIIAGTAHIGKTIIESCPASNYSSNTVSSNENSNVIVGRLVDGTLIIGNTTYTTSQNIFTIS